MRQNETLKYLLSIVATVRKNDVDVGDLKEILLQHSSGKITSK